MPKKTITYAEEFKILQNRIKYLLSLNEIKLKSKRAFEAEYFIVEGYKIAGGRDIPVVNLCHSAGRSILTVKLEG